MRSIWVVVYALLLANQGCQAIIIEIGLYQKEIDGRTINLFLFVNDSPSPLDTQANTAKQRQDFIKFLQTNNPEILIEDNGSYDLDNPQARAHTKAIFKEYHAIDFSIGLIQILAKHAINATNLENRQLLFAAMPETGINFTKAIVNDIDKKREYLEKYISSNIPKEWNPLPSYIENIMRQMKWKGTKKTIQSSSDPMDFNHPYWFSSYTRLMECSILTAIFSKTQSASSICCVINKDTEESLRKILIKIGFIKEDGEYAPGEIVATTANDLDEEGQEVPITTNSFTITAPLNIEQALASIVSRTIGQQTALSTTITPSSSSTTMSSSLTLAEEEPKRKHDSLSIQIQKRPSLSDGMTPTSSPTSPLSKKNLLLKSPSSSSTSSTSPLPSREKVLWIDVEKEGPVAQIKVLSPEENKERFDYNIALTNEIINDVHKKIQDELDHEPPDIETIGSLLSNLAWALTPDDFYKYLKECLKAIQPLYTSEGMSSVATSFKKALKRRSSSQVIKLLQSYIIEPTAAPDVPQAAANQLEVWYKKFDDVASKSNQEIVAVILEAAQQIGLGGALDLSYHVLTTLRSLKMGLKIAQIKIALTNIFISHSPTDDPEAMAAAKLWEKMLAEFV